MRITTLLLALLMSVMSTCSVFAQSRRAQVKMTTNYGTIVLELYNETPLHRDNFIRNVKSGVYKGTLFHRVIKDFMIQGGASNSRGAAPGVMLGDDPNDTDCVPAEFRFPEIYHRRGVIGAAREGDEVNPEMMSSQFQFYIVWGRQLDDRGLDATQRHLDQRAKCKVTLTPEIREVYRQVGGTPHLDGAYTVFGEVVSGLDVVDKIQHVATDSNDRPKEDVVIKKIKVTKMWK